MKDVLINSQILYNSIVYGLELSKDFYSKALLAILKKQYEF